MKGVEAEAGALPISGEYLSPFTWTGPETPNWVATSPSGVTNSTDFSAGATINNGQEVDLAEFTKLEVGGKDILGDAEVTLVVFQFNHLLTPLATPLKLICSG